MKIAAYQISNHQGEHISVSNYGARLLKWLVTIQGQEQGQEQQRNIILAYPKLEDYLNDASYLGAVVGPYANRIANARAPIDKCLVELNANEGQHQLHGGEQAIANQYWDVVDHQSNSISLSCELADGFNGYPGPMTIKVDYHLSEHSELIINIEVSSEQLTIAGPTTHPYFNLDFSSDINPDSASSINAHQLQLLTEHYTPLNHQNISIGTIESVKNSIYDFSNNKVIGDTELDDNFIYQLSDCGQQPPYPQAILTAPDGSLALHVSSNYPALQVYSGQHLNAPFNARNGICLEPQFCPDSPNQPRFPFSYTSKQQPLKRQIIYRLARSTPAQ